MVEIIEILQSATANPVVMGAILTVIFNIGGYIGAMLKVKAFESYDKYKPLETLALFETVFIALQAVAGVDSKWVAIIAIAVNVIYGLKKALPNKTP